MNTLEEIRAMVRSLPSERYLQAEGKAKEYILANNPKPLPEQFGRTVYKYPPVLTLGMLGILVIVAGAAWFVSAGKQMIAMDMYLKPMLNDQSVVGEDYIKLAIYLMLLVGELGTLAFSFASSLYAGKTHRIGKYEISVDQILFRSFAISCALIAIVANGSLTMIHQKELQSIILLSWIITFSLPSLVLGIGLVGEKMLIDWLEQRQISKQIYQTKLDEYHRIMNDPMGAGNWVSVFRRMLFDEIVKYQTPTVKAQLQEAVNQTPMLRLILVAHEEKRNNWDLSGDLTIALPATANGNNPTTITVAPQITAQPIVDRLEEISNQLSNGLSVSGVAATGETPKKTRKSPERETVEKFVQAHGMGNKLPNGNDWSARNIATYLNEQGHKVSYATVSRTLKDLGENNEVSDQTTDPTLSE